MRYLMSVILVLLAFNTECSSMYRIYLCKDLDAGTQLVFRNEDSMRMITFMEIEKEFAIKFPEAKAILSWSDVKEVQFHQQNDDGLMKLKLNGVSKIFHTDVLEFGEIDCSCWKNLKSKYSDNFLFNRK